MTNAKKNQLMLGLLSALFVVGIGSAQAADTTLTNTLNNAYASRDLDDVRDALDDQPRDTDTIVRSLLQQTQKDMKADADFSNDMMTLAGQYAPKITPPSVPAVCADLRRVVGALTPDQTGTDLYTTVMGAAASFAQSPVVVAAGKPNLCEEAFLQVAAAGGDEALLAQLPSNPHGRVKVITVENGTPRAPTVRITTVVTHEKPHCDHKPRRDERHHRKHGGPFGPGHYPRFPS